MTEVRKPIRTYEEAERECKLRKIISGGSMFMVDPVTRAWEDETGKDYTRDEAFAVVKVDEQEVRRLMFDVI